MFENLGFHFEYFTPLTISLLVIGAIVGYGGKFILKLFNKNPSEKSVLILKLVGLIMVLAGIIILFKS